MSLDVVSKKLEVIAQKRVVKEEDIAEVIVAAERSQKGRSDGVSNAEARAVADFYLRAKAGTPSPKVAVPVLEDGAVNKLNAFFMAHSLPYGQNKGPMKDRILSALSKLEGLGEPMAQKPRTGSLQPLRLTPNDAPERRDAYVDVVKKQFIVKVAEQFYGPFALND